MTCAATGNCRGHDTARYINGREQMARAQSPPCRQGFIYEQQPNLKGTTFVLNKKALRNHIATSRGNYYTYTQD